MEEAIWHHDDWVGHPNFKRVPVIVRYQFKLHRRRMSGPAVMLARFTQSLDPDFEQTSRWRDAGADVQAYVRSCVNRAAEYEPFSALQVKTWSFDSEGSSADTGIFCFVRRQVDDTPVVEESHYWSRFPPIAILAEVREKLHMVFHIDLIVIQL